MYKKKFRGSFFQRNSKHFLNKTIFILFFVFFSCTLSKSEKTLKFKPPFLWKIKHNKAVVYITGSVHVGKKELYPLHPRIEEAYSLADTVVTEFDFSEITTNEGMLSILKYSIYSGNDSLFLHISEKTRKLLSLVAKKHNLPEDKLKKFKPWYLVNFINSLEWVKYGISPDFGIDQYFYSKAKKDGKRVVGLETMEFQLELMGNLEDSIQDNYLFQCLNQSDSLENLTLKLINHVFYGDTEGLNELFIQEYKKNPEMKVFYQKILEERNLEWIKKIEIFFSTGKVYFVVIGAGHLIAGKIGLLELLRSRGFYAEQG